MGVEDGNQDVWAKYSNRSTPFSPKEKEAFLHYTREGE
jgi:hypothetical protein